MIRIYHSYSWEETPCVILNSELELVNFNIYSPQRNTYNPKLIYEYRFKEESYLGNKFNFDDMASNLSRAEGIIAKFPIGLKTKCYVNQDNPSEAVLSRDTYPQLWFCITPLFFLILIVFMFVAFHLDQKHLLKMVDTQKFNRRENKNNKI